MESFFVFRVVKKEKIEYSNKKAVIREKNKFFGFGSRERKITMTEHKPRHFLLLRTVVSMVLVVAVAACAILVFVHLKNRQERLVSSAKNAQPSETTMEIQSDNRASKEDEQVFIIKGNDKSSNKFERADKLSYTTTVQYTIEDLKQLDSYGLRITRNEIYARHGRMFVDQDLQTYFDRQEWYVPEKSPTDFDDNELNEIEMYNAVFILNYEKSMNY